MKKNFSKKEIRKLIYALRKKHSLELLNKWSKEICRKIAELSVYKKSTYIAFYFAKAGEVDLKILIGRAFLEGKKIFLPKTHLQERILTFHQIFSFSDLIPGSFNILEPPYQNPEIDIKKLELIFVPGVAFDMKKGRIGYGGGFYDKVLAKTKAFKIGVAFSFQIFDTLPLEPHDQKLDLIITEKEIINGRY
ncbi:5-formyltetrahydrofolate cyclo-ligase [Thermodesulfobacterium hydrogeniphilum]|uniref:5-formyltetrahydrofolate cyclo-ligase n=1 Tax=Thermodesulfobacterium hydrogeniphilum TaxID=161156 RepID=UPI00056EF39E|nr:5-formyltetrahydrofolate cyclo-ligase [Thermodesulfobacterium hydrogeniphilum]